MKQIDHNVVNLTDERTHELGLRLGIFLVMQPAQDSLARFRVIGLNKLFPEAEGGEFRPLVTLHKKAALVGKDRRFDQDDFRNLASSKTKCHYRSTSESSPIISRSAWGILSSLRTTESL